MWWSARSPLSGWSPNSRRSSPQLAVRRSAADGQWSGVGFLSAATVLREQDRHFLHSAGLSLGQRLYRIIQQQNQEGMPQPQPLDHPVRGPSSDRRLQGRAQPPTPAFSPGLPNTGRVRCPMQPHPLPRGLRDQLNPNNNNLALEPGGLNIGDSPCRS